MIFTGLYLMMLMAHLYVTWVLWRTKNGYFRKALIAYFASVSWAIMIRLTAGNLHLTTEATTMLVAIPMTITSVILAIYIKEHFD